MKKPDPSSGRPGRISWASEPSPEAAGGITRLIRSGVPLCIAIILLLTLAGPVMADPNPIIGCWTAQPAQGNAFTIVFLKDGTWSDTLGEVGTWDDKANTFTVTKVNGKKIKPEVWAFKIENVNNGINNGFIANNRANKNPNFIFNGVRQPNPPRITSISPQKGPVTGNTRVIIKGGPFKGKTRVFFDGTPADNQKVLDENTLDVTSPDHDESGCFNLLVETNGCATAVKFMYIPVVKDISPASGLLDGGEKVTLAGFGFNDVEYVKLEALPGFLDPPVLVEPTPVSLNKLTYTAPSHANNLVWVGVINDIEDCEGCESDSQRDHVLYLYTFPIPTLKKITPNYDNVTGGTRITLTGKGWTLKKWNVPIRVYFGNNPTPPESKSETKITVISLPSPNKERGWILLSVCTPTGCSGLPFCYGPPKITSISPASGPTNGGTDITISGYGFNDTTKVMFGSTVATYNVISDTKITATSPPHTAGDVSVVVEAYCNSSITSNKKFEYK